MSKPTFIGLFAFSLTVAAASSSHALIGGTLVDDEGSGFVSIHGSTALGRCFSDAEIIHGELVGWFMGSEDSDRNPIREVYPHPTLNAALVRIAKPLATTRPGAPYELFPLRSSELAGRPLTCLAYGPRTTTELAYGTRLTSGTFNVANVNGHTLMIQSAATFFSAIDQGGGCIVTHEGRPFLAGIIGTTNSNPTSVDALRTFITSFRTWHQISSTEGDLCVDIPSASNAVNQSPQAYPCNAGANQSWSMRAIGGGNFEVRAKHSNLCLAADGARVVQVTCGADMTDPHPRNLPKARSLTQAWRISNAGGPNGLSIENVAKAGTCLDRTNARQLSLAACNKTARPQQWRIDATTLDNRDHRLAAPDACVATKDGPRNGAKLVADTCSGKDPQEWRFERTESPYFRVQAKDSRYSRCMDVSGANTQAGSVVHEWDCAPTAANQRWRAEWQPTGGTYGTYMLRAKHSNLCATRMPTSELQQQPCDPNNGKQSWSID
jgi:hypothetical protein